MNLALLAARQRCIKVARQIASPAPLTFDQMIDNAARHRHRPITPVGTDLDGTTPCGILITTNERDLILYPNSATPLHRKHIVAHEIGHLMLGHTGTHKFQDDLLRRLTPNLSQDLIRRLLGRTTYEDRQEREAEVFATVLLTTAAEQDRPHSVHADTSAARLGNVYDPPPWAA